MAKQQNENTEELREKKRMRKGMIILVLFIAILTPVIWYGLEWLATEHVLSKTPVKQNGKDLIVQFSEKTRGYRNKNSQTNTTESGTSHYGYNIELIDSLSHKSLNKIKFDSPYRDIQNTPEMVIDSNHVVWIISTTRLYDYDEMGYIMKFTIENEKVVQKDFKLPGSYCVREIEDHKVYLTKDMDSYHGHSPVFSYTYFDLNTGKVIDKKGAM